MNLINYQMKVEISAKQRFALWNAVLKKLQDDKDAFGTTVGLCRAVLECSTKLGLYIWRENLKDTFPEMFKYEAEYFYSNSFGPRFKSAFWFDPADADIRIKVVTNILKDLQNEQANNI